MRFRYILTIAFAAVSVANAAQAAPGVGDPVYGATLRKGVTEFEARYGRLTGGQSNGEDGLILEAEHDFSNHFAGAILVETGRNADDRRLANSASIEAIYTLGRIEALDTDVALYGEYKFGFRSNSDVLESKLLLEHRVAAFDARLNLVAEHALRRGDPVTLGYAASVDWTIAGDDLRAGFAAFGDAGTTQAFGGRQEHYAGPEIKAEIERFGPGELEIEAGWLRAFGAARDASDGQARLLIDYELHF